jgi:thiol reductant ABC exporter CydC subunit
VSGVGTLRGWWSGSDRRERAALALAVALATAAALATPALLGLSGYLLARAAEQPEILTLAVAIVGVRFFGLLRAAARYGERLVVHDLALGRLSRVRVAVFEALIPRVPGRLGGRTSADALDAVVSDVDRLADLPVRVLVPAAASLLAALACGAAATLILPAAGALLALVLAAQAAFLALLSGRDAGLGAAERSTARGELSRELVILLDAAPELVAWGAANARAARVERAGRRVDRLAAAAARVASAAGATTVLAAGAGALAMLAVAAPAAAGGRIGGVMVAALALLALGAAEVVGGAGDTVVARREVAAAGKRLERLVGSPRVRGGSGRPRHGGIALRGVTLERAGRRILDRVDLDVAPGERVALTGASGVGKSTLADALVGFAEPSAGEMRAGGVDLADVDGAALRETVRWIPQDPHIFATTIAANVRIAAPGADDATIDAALRAVGAGPWLDALPDGLETRLGEFGERCSGGERQRVGLARAYLCGGGLVVLDEPASHLPHGEALQALSAVMDAEPGRGALLITHRREEAALAEREVRLGASREGPQPTVAAPRSSR